MYENILKSAQLQDNEITIYTFLISSGGHTATQIMDHAKLKRGNTYYILDNLIKKGLVEEYKVGKKTHFRPTHPSKLEAHVEQQRRDIDEAVRQVHAILPGLTTEYNLNYNLPGVYTFEGKDGVIKVYEELLADKLPIDSIEDKGEMAEFIPEYANEFIRKRVKHKIFNRVVAPSTNTINVNKKSELRETRYVDVELFPFSMDIKITAKKIVMVTFQRNTVIGVIIMHPEIIRNYQILFNFLWNIAPKLANSTSTKKR